MFLQEAREVSLWQYICVVADTGAKEEDLKIERLHCNLSKCHNYRWK